MDYEQKYKEALERAKRFETAEYKSIVASIFPELQESKDELTWLTKYIEEEAYYLSMDIRDDEDRIKLKNFQRSLAWLEKQGEKETDKWKDGNIIKHGGILALVIKGRKAMKSNGDIFTVQYPAEWVKASPNEVEHFLNEFEKRGGQKPYGQRQECVDCQFNYAGECKGFCAMKRGKQNPADKVEPKFKVGDWITNGEYTWCVESVKSLDYGLIDKDGRSVYDDVSYVDSHFHLWTMRDARTGDILTTTPGFTFIFKNIDSEGRIHYYCANEDKLHEGDDTTFHVAMPESLIGDINNNLSKHAPATKEQRDLLFSKMEEAGYWWDAVNLELTEKFFKTPEESLGISSEEYNKIINDCLFSDDEKPNFRERYKNIKNSEWFKKTHENMSVSDDDKEDVECKCIEWDNESFNRTLSEMSDKLDKLYELVGEVKQLIKHFNS